MEKKKKAKMGISLWCPVSWCHEIGQLGIYIEKVEE